MWQTYLRSREDKVLSEIRALGAGEGWGLSDKLDVLQITLDYHAPTLIVVKALKKSRPHKRVVGYLFSKNPLKVHALMERAELPFAPFPISGLGRLMFRIADFLKIYSVIGHYAVRFTPQLLD